MVENMKPDDKGHAEKQIEEYLKSRWKPWKLVVSFIIGNVVLFATAFGALFSTLVSRAADEAILKADAPHMSLAESIKSGLARQYQSSQDLASSIAVTITEHRALRDELAELRDAQIDIEAIQQNTRGELERSFSEIETQHDQLRDQIQRDIVRKRQELEAIEHQIGAMQRRASGLTGEEGEEKLARMRELAESLEHGEPLQQLVEIKSGLRSLERAITASELPIGSIIPFVGNLDEIVGDARWVPCDGAAIPTESPLYKLGMTKTPDLSEAFLRGATAVGGDIGRPGGNSTAKVQIQSAGEHQHSVRSHSHTLASLTGSIANHGPDPGKHPYLGLDDRAGWGSGGKLSTGGPAHEEGQHRHDLGSVTNAASVSTDNTGAHTHAAKPIAVLPPYVNVYFIIRIR